MSNDRIPGIEERDCLNKQPGVKKPTISMRLCGFRGSLLPRQERIPRRACASGESGLVLGLRRDSHCSDGQFQVSLLRVTE